MNMAVRKKTKNTWQVYLNGTVTRLFEHMMTKSKHMFFEKLSSPQLSNAIASYIGYKKAQAAFSLYEKSKTHSFSLAEKDTGRYWISGETSASSTQVLFCFARSSENFSVVPYVLHGEQASFSHFQLQSVQSE